MITATKQQRKHCKRVIGACIANALRCFTAACSYTACSLHTDTASALLSTTSTHCTCSQDVILVRSANVVHRAQEHSSTGLHPCHQQVVPQRVELVAPVVQHSPQVGVDLACA